MSAQTAHVRMEQPVSIFREVIAVTVNLDILAATAKQVRHVTFLPWSHDSVKYSPGFPF